MDESVLGRFKGSPAKCLSPGGECRKTLPASLHPPWPPQPQRGICHTRSIGLLRQTIYMFCYFSLTDISLGLCTVSRERDTTALDAEFRLVCNFVTLSIYATFNNTICPPIHPGRCVESGSSDEQVVREMIPNNKKKKTDPKFQTLENSKSVSLCNLFISLDCCGG